MKTLRLLAFTLLIANSVAASEVSETVQHTFDFRPAGRISLENINGDITIEAGQGDQILLTAVKRATSEKDLAEMRVDIDATEARLRVETRYAGGMGRWFGGASGKGSVTYRLVAPPGTELDLIETVNGNITIHRMSGPVKCSNVNGLISLDGLRGSAELGTVNGGIDAGFTQVAAGQRVSAEAVNGRILLRLPANASAVIDATTLNGGIEASDFGLQSEPGMIGHNLDGRLGDGGATIKLATVNGAIQIQNDQQ